MQRNLFQPFAELGTKLRSRSQTDPFYTTRVQLMLMYFAIGAVIFMFLGWFVSSIRFAPVLEMTSIIEPGSLGQIAYEEYQREVFWRRLILVIVFVVATYFVTEFALRSIRKSVELQHRFFGTVSHELRTPLTVMKNAAEVALRNPSLTPEKAERVIRSMLEETDHMSRTLNFLLSLTSLSMQKSIPDMQVLSLSIIAQEALTSLDAEAKTRNVHLTHELTGEGYVRGNPAALHGLLVNLITNALRYTPQNGKVDVRVEEHRGVQLTVSDTGAGIPTDELPYVFEPFYQGRLKGEGNHEGFGLGLSLVREVSRLHDAHIHVRSTLGEGTTFTIQFPVVTLSR